jgi:hypothetical protein
MSVEQKEDIMQNSLMRVWSAYQRLSAGMGWKSFIQTHCQGAVLDFIKLGKFDDGFVKSDDPTHLSDRVEVNSFDGDMLSVEETAALFGVYFDTNQIKKAFEPRYDLLKKLVVYDVDLHIVVKVIFGHSQEEIAEQYAKAYKTISRERISQKVREFFARLDSGENYNCPLTDETIYALGMCDVFNMPDKSNEYGWDIEPIDIFSPDSFLLAKKANEKTNQVHQIPFRFEEGMAV